MENTKNRLWKTDLDADMQIAHISGDILAEQTQRFLYGYVILLVLATVYCIYKKSGIGFSEYVLKVFFNLMKTYIVFGLLSFGVLFITGIVDTLLILVVIAVFVPGINMYKVPNLSQSYFLKKYYQEVLDGRGLSANDYERLKGSYKYLDRQAQTKEFAAQYDIYNDSFAQKLNEIEIADSMLTGYDTHAIHCCQLVGTLDVGGYQRMDMLNQADYYDNRIDGPIEVFYPNQNGEKITVFYGSGNPIDFTAFQFIKRATGERITVDISEFAWKCMLYEAEHPDADSTEISDAMRGDNCVQIDENTVFYMNHFQIRYSEGVKNGEPYFEWYKPTINGMLLTKD